MSMSRASQLRSSDVYYYHKLALSPFVLEDSESVVEVVKKDFSIEEQGVFFDFVISNGLSSLWWLLLKREGLFSSFPSLYMKKLKSVSFLEIARYLQQENGLNLVAAIFNKQNINFVVFKGAHVRELVYDIPASRPSADVDILVSKEDKDRAVAALIQDGGTFLPVENNISHEVTINYQGVGIDLHWEIMRPGRTREDLTRTLLETSREYSTHRGLDNEATLFLMLVHPVFTEYSTTHLALLVKVVDLFCWTQKQTIDYKKVQSLLERGGVSTAAWITTQRLEMLTGITLPELFIQSIKPSIWKAYYLEKWISNDFSSRLFKYQIIVQAGLTLPAHDTISDVFRAFFSLRRESKSAARKIRELIDFVEGDKFDDTDVSG